MYNEDTMYEEEIEDLDEEIRECCDCGERVNLVDCETYTLYLNTDSGETIGPLLLEIDETHIGLLSSRDEKCNGNQYVQQQKK